MTRLRETTENHDLEVVVAVDADRASRALLEPLADRLLWSEEYRGCSRAWNDCLAVCSGDPVVFAADDLVWQDGWLDAALGALEEHPGCLVGFNDGHWNAELSTHYLMPRNFIVEVLGGVVAWDYPHSFNDLETCERAKSANRYHWCEEARVYHAHWLFGDRPQDSTDTRNLGGHPEAQRMFNERKAAGFPDDFEAVIKC